MGDFSDNNSPELGRRASRTASTRMSIGPGDEDDDYDLQAFGVSDGFRPAEVAHSHIEPDVARPSPSSGPVPRPVSPRPASIEKPSPTHETTLSCEQSEPVSAVSPSASTGFPVMPIETPYDGPSGPSHPYQMYPQNVRLARVTSSTTVSTGSISEQTYNGPHHPTHPYGIYPQNVASGDDEASSPTAQRQVNVGFPGTADRYQRRLGPDGEEAADMIGPDGHTEQLPPYTRYPDEACGRKPVAANAFPSEEQNLEIPGAGGIGLATRNPEFASTEDLNRANSSRSRRSARSIRSEASHHSIHNTPLVVTNEKSTPNWKEAARRRVWGVPCWAVVLGVIFMVLLGVVVGTVIGIHLNQGPRPENSNSNSGPRFIPGYIPLTSVPPGLPALPEGSYTLPLSHPRFSNKCIKDPSQSEAWNCDVVMSDLIMTISRRQDSVATAAYSLEFSYNTSFTEDAFVYSYGVQPPSLVPQQLLLVNDTFEAALGPAWAFVLPYNKTVILPETYLTTNNGTSLANVEKRITVDDLAQKGLVQNGDHPWICTWPSTILEVFIYAGQDEGSSNGNANVSKRNELADKDHRGVLGRQYGRNSHQESEPPYTHQVVPSALLPTISSTSPTPTTTTSSAQPDYFSPAPMPTPQYSPYPKYVKYEERRDPDVSVPAPVCRQVQVLANGEEALPVLNSSGFPVAIQISEILPANEARQLGVRTPRQRSLHEMTWTQLDDDTYSGELAECGCIWWLL